RQWGDVLANLAWIVVDEAHVYRGVFGSHVANVLRRLLRVARAYGTEPRFVLTSATIANPVELGEGLTGKDVLLVDRDGAPRAERRVAMWNPPLTDEASGARVSALSEAAGVLTELVENEVRTICFLKSRRGVELIQKFTRMRLEEAGGAEPAERCTSAATTRSTSSSAATPTSSSSVPWSRRSSTTSPRASTCRTWWPPPTSCP